MNAREFHWAVAYNGNFYGVTQYGENGWEPKMYKYDFENDTWKYLYHFNLDPPLFHFIPNDKLYIYPEQFNSTSLSFYELDIEQGALTGKRDFPGNYWSSRSTERHAISIDEHGYLILRNNPVELWEYDPVLDIWIERERFIDSRMYGIAYTNLSSI